MTKEYDERMTDLFISEIKKLCEHVFISIEILNSGLSESSNRHVFYAIHNMFTAWGNISKIFYPTQQYRARGKFLREIFGINEDSQFYFDKKMKVVRKYRNILEHYDEYLEDWYTTKDNSVVIEDCIGPLSMISVNGETPKPLRHYDPMMHKFIYQDNEYSIQAAIDETKKIYQKILMLEEMKYGGKQR